MTWARGSTLDKTGGGGVGEVKEAGDEGRDGLLTGEQAGGH
jgi:hypothetical protein